MAKAKKKNFYAVVKGRKPGIYLEWYGPQGAEAQVSGFEGSVYRGFATRREAEEFLASEGRVVPAPTESADGEPAEPIPDYRAELAAGRVVIFCDGASSGNPGPGGYGVVLLYQKARRELSGGFRCTTNNRMELWGCIAGLEALERPSTVSLYSDSRYVVNAVRQGWARRWQKNGWLRSPNAQGEVQRAENVDLWERLLALLDRHDVTFYWVRGHASHPENERCDRLAVAAARQPNLPADPGFPAELCRGAGPQGAPSREMSSQ